MSEQIPPYRHGFTVRWSSFWGNVSENSCHGYPTEDEARESMTRMLAASDWTPVKWWKFWRWGDTPFTPSSTKGE